MSADPGLMRPARPRVGTASAASGRGAVTRRVVMLAGRAEAARLCRSPLVLGGLAVAAALVWWNSRTTVPQWWVWDVQIGSSLLALAGPVLVAAQLAAGRVRRDGATQLYDSYPASAPMRSGAHLLGVAGPLMLAGALTGGAVIWLELLGSVGTARPAVLVQGVLLVALGGVAGVALGSWLAHPVAGILAVIVIGAAEADLLVPFGGPVQPPGGSAWLFPWSQPAVLRWLPGPVVAIPPGAHLAWLVMLAALAAIAALWRGGFRQPRPRVTILAALGMVGCLALAGRSGWAQIHPVPASAEDSLIYQAVHPASVEQCITQARVRYCAYPGFGRDVARWAGVVNGLLGRLPARPRAELVVRQVVDVNVYTSPLYGGYPPATASEIERMSVLAGRLGRFVSAQGYDAHLVPGSSQPPVYTDINWGVGSLAGSYQLGLALQVAWWIARLPTTWQRSVSYSCGQYCDAEAQVSCLPVGQAREAIALWLAASATPATRPAFLSGLRSGAGVSKVGGAWLASYTGVTGYGYQPGLQQFTGQAAVLAEAMLRLPERRVEAVLAARWPGWLRPRATDAQLAAALRIPLPPAPPAAVSAFDRGQPADPVCQ